MRRQPTTGRFLSTLSLRRATPGKVKVVEPGFVFLSTLSLRRATELVSMLNSPHGKFLSTLSLRRATVGQKRLRQKLAISIHALLAESDSTRSQPGKPKRLFLSTLSLRRATWQRGSRITYVEFLSTLSLRRATVFPDP